MAGTLVISTLSDGTNSTSSTNAIKGSAKAWVNFQGSGSTATIRGSYNVSSITRNSTGYYTITFTNALTDANYSAVGGAQINNGGSTFILPFIYGNPNSPYYTAPTTSAFTVLYCGSFGTGALAEPQYATISVSGN